MTADGPQRLTGFRLRDHDDAMTRFAASRRSQSLNHQQLAERIGVARQQIYSWERGKTWPLAGNLFALAHALGYDLALIPRTKEQP